MAAEAADVVVMSYEVLRADVDWVSRRSWAYCVLDEGHIIRNPRSKLAQARAGASLACEILLSDPGCCGHARHKHGDALRDLTSCMHE